MAAKNKLLNVYSAWQVIDQYEIETGVDGLTEFSGVWAYTPTKAAMVPLRTFQK